MNIGIIHLTDLHIGSSNNQYSGKISEIVKAIKGICSMLLLYI